ncbi:MAG: hypothetical protein CMG46_02740 [Candidatus Marinimicrobia bacterium]|nr:hypothetical protein [Candidatus Neomarinimicrobiota bacterium]|tara:strand:+ start:167 stop:556 length:390 start_codon:yes stop_codon:yes gene_type:complete
MNNYYLQFIKNHLRDDILQEITVDKENYPLLLKELNILIQKVDFEEKVKNTSKTHMIRDRVLYKDRDNLCKARVWNEGYGGQCSQKASCNGFCKTHFKKGGINWWLGTIDGPRPERPINERDKIHVWLN